MQLIFACYLCIFLLCCIHLLVLQLFLVESLEFSTHKIISSANRCNFTSFPIWMLYVIPITHMIHLLKSKSIIHFLHVWSLLFLILYSLHLLLWGFIKLSSCSLILSLTTSKPLSCPSKTFFISFTVFLIFTFYFYS